MILATSSSLIITKLLFSAISEMSVSGFLMVSIASFRTLSFAILPSAKSVNTPLKWSRVNTSMSWPSLLISRRSYARSEATGVASTLTSAKMSSNISASCLLTSCVAKSSLNLYSSIILACLTSGNSGKSLAIGSILSAVILNNGISVSRYILFAVGRGLIYSVFPSSNAFLVSSTTPSNAMLALLITSFKAFTATSSSWATMIIASSGLILRNSFMASTSSAPIP